MNKGSAALIVTAKHVYMVIGLFCFSAGMAMTLQAMLGLASWTVFHQAIASLTGLTYGRVSQIVGIIIVLLSLVMGIRPSLTTLTNVLLVGPMVDWSRAALIPVPAAFGWKLLLLIGGNAVMGFGTAMYTSAGTGAGPRDSLMLALTRLSKLNVGTVRTLMELIVLVAGFLMGGPVGLGTVVSPFVVGWSVARSFEVFRRLSRLTWLSWLLKVPVPRAGADQGLFYKVRQVWATARTTRGRGTDA